MSAPFEVIVLGMGCFWGAEKRMSSVRGVIAIESGYANGEIEGSYEAILRHEQARQHGRTLARNHAEVVKLTFDPTRVDLEEVLATFWESHDPTQGERQGADVGSNYRSAIYVTEHTQLARAQASRERYQQALIDAGWGRITTEIERLTTYHRAEEYHQRYLVKNPGGYCGLGGTGVPCPRPRHEPGSTAHRLVVFAAAHDEAYRQFETDILANWRSGLPVSRVPPSTESSPLPLQGAIGPGLTIVLFEQGRERSRFAGYDGNALSFWRWLGQHLLSPEQQRIAFEQGTERPFSSALLDEKRSGRFVDPITGASLFRSETRFESGCGWPSFFDPIENALSFHEDHSHGMSRIEVRSASSGIHLGHVFEDGPPPTGQRYCINGKVLRFVPDDEEND